MNHYPASLFDKPEVMTRPPDKVEPPPQIDGDTCEEKLDGPRLRKQLDRVREYMLDIFPTWKSLDEIQEYLENKYKHTKFPTPSIGARLRDLRKEKFGNYFVDGKRRVPGGGEHEYLVYPKDGLI